MIKVALFDDNALLRDSVSLLIQDAEDMILCGAFEDCRNVLRDIERSAPDVVLMDIDMPGINGIEGVRLIHKTYPELKVLMQTVFEDDDKVFAAIKAGAAGYLLKNAGAQKLLEAIREVQQGGAPLTPSIAMKVLQHFQADPTVPEAEDFQLSPREKDVLALLIKGYSYKMIADSLSISYPTVRTHMTRIYEKLHVSSMTEAVAKALNQKMFPHL